MLIKSKNFSAGELHKFRKFQSLSFDILENTAYAIEAGETEREVARDLFRAYRKAGVKSFFHLPVVLFGSRTALPGDWKFRNFFPRPRRLVEGDSVILDASPIFNGYMVDTSYSFCFGASKAHAKMMRNLSKFRTQILDAVNAKESFQSIAEDVADDICKMGYEPAHTKHPGEVLGHRAVKTANLPGKFRIRGSDGLALGWFILRGKMIDAGWSKKPALWNESEDSDHSAQDGLWLVEPHAGAGEIGAKWEEIMIIQNGRARWLQRRPPHVRQWVNIQNGLSYGPEKQEIKIRR